VRLERAAVRASGAASQFAGLRSLRWRGASDREERAASAAAGPLRIRSVRVGAAVGAAQQLLLSPDRPFGPLATHRIRTTSTLMLSQQQETARL
jgi:hypothetical protein